MWYIEHLDPTFRYKASFATTSDPIQFEYELKSDGQEVVARQPGVTSASRLCWDGNALVSTMRMQRADSEMTISFRFGLLDAGRRLQAKEPLRGTDHDQDNIWVFDRSLVR